MIQTRKNFFIAILDQFANTGDELLNILDAIESGAIQYHNEED